MNEKKTYPFPGKQMMLCSGTWGGYKDIDFPYVLLKGYWFRLCGFNSGDEVTIINTGPGILVLQVTKTRDEFQRAGWPNRYHRHNGLSMPQLLKFADDLLTSSQVFAHQVLEYSKLAA